MIGRIDRIVFVDIGIGTQYGHISVQHGQRRFLRNNSVGTERSVAIQSIGVETRSKTIDHKSGDSISPLVIVGLTVIAPSIQAGGESEPLGI